MGGLRASRELRALGVTAIRHVNVSVDRDDNCLVDAIPPRGPALPESRMLVSFDIDCGELVKGHHFIVRGICDQGTIESHDGASAPGFSLEYELVPGVAQLNSSQRLFDYLVGVDYRADSPLPWDPSDGGAIAPFEGGASTHGSRGDWPLPKSARTLRFYISGIDPATGFQRDREDGVLVVELQEGSARWEPTT
jgi:hypothetical protein